jgi:hypothetical protein
MSALRGGRAEAWVVPLLLAVATAGLFAWTLTLRFTTPEPFQDFRFHNQAAADMAAGGPLELPHPLYHALAAVLAWALRLDIAWAGMTVAVAAQVALALIAYFDLAAVTRWPLQAAQVALTLTVAAPLNWLTPKSREFYFGYLFPNALHNPTIILLRPLSLALFLGCAAVLTAAAPPSPARATGLALLTVACALAKPSYVICVLPALAAVWLLEGGRVDRRWTTLALAVIVPGAAVAAAQAWFTLTTDQMEPTTIVLAPLKVVFLHTRRNLPLVGLKFVLSIVFPFAVACAFAAAALRDAALRLAWLAFLAGALYAYGLAETGERMIHGNFLWSGQAAAAVLFVASARFWLARGTEPGTRVRWGACAVALLLHLLAGVAYLVHFARTGEGF